MGEREWIDFSCNKCGATMKPTTDGKSATCEYCGNMMLLEQEESLEELREKEKAKSYGYHQGKLLAQKEAQKREKWKRILVFVCMLGVFALIFGVVVFSKIVGAFTEALAMPAVNPFELIEVSFRGDDGDGEVVLEKLSVEGIDGRSITYEVYKAHDLSLEDTVTVVATSDAYRLTERERVYQVEGLNEYLTDLENISEEVLETIHIRAEAGLDFNLESSKKREAFQEMKPIKMYLFTDGKRENYLYDVFEAKFNTSSGEKICYLMVKFDDVILGAEGSDYVSMKGGMYQGGLTRIDTTLYLTGYDSMEVLHADILGREENRLERKELELE